MPQNIISAKNITKSFKNKKNIETPVLKGISLNFEEGGFIALMGPSGAGKSTFLSIIGCLDSADSGETLFSVDGTTYTSKKMKLTELANFRNKFIGFVFQFHHLLPEFTALENVMMPALIAGTKYTTAKQRANELLKIVDVDLRSDHKPSELSGGEQQRIAIARAIMNNPKILLADEPTGNLDLNNSKKVLDLLINLKNELNMTLVIATHSNEVAKTADKIITMKDGVLI